MEAEKRDPGNEVGRPRAVISDVLKLTSIGGVQNMYTFAISLI